MKLRKNSSHLYKHLTNWHLLCAQCILVDKLLMKFLLNIYWIYKYALILTLRCFHIMHLLITAKSREFPFSLLSIKRLTFLHVHIILHMKVWHNFLVKGQVVHIFTLLDMQSLQLHNSGIVERKYSQKINVLEWVGQCSKEALLK